MKEEKKVIKLEVFDEIIEVKVRKGNEKKFHDAAKLVSERYAAYMQRYRGEKSDHTIALMTMLDIAIKLAPDNTIGSHRHSFWNKMKDYIGKLW